MLYSCARMPSVFIIASDWMLRTGVRAELRERGIDALGFETPSQAGEAIVAGKIPGAVVVESGVAAQSDPAVTALMRNVPTVWLSPPGIGETPPPDAAAVMRRPFSIGDVVQRVCELLQGQAA